MGRVEGEALMAESQLVFDIRPHNVESRVCISYIPITTNGDSVSGTGHQGSCQTAVGGHAAFGLGANMTVDYAVSADGYPGAVGKAMSGATGESRTVVVELVKQPTFDQLPRGTLASVGFLFALGAAAVMASRR